MKLASYLEHHGIGFSEFARRLGINHARTVERWAKGQRIPAGGMMAAIVAATAGAVQPADFVSAGEPARGPQAIRRAA